MAETAQACMAMHDLDLLPYNDVAKYWKERENCRESRGSIDDKERDMVDFEAIGEVSDASSAFVRMRYNDDLVASIDQLCRELINVTLDSSRLWKEEVADHSNIVWHLVDFGSSMLEARSPSMPLRDGRFVVKIRSVPINSGHDDRYPPRIYIHHSPKSGFDDSGDYSVTLLAQHDPSSAYFESDAISESARSAR